MVVCVAVKWPKSYVCIFVACLATFLHHETNESINLATKKLRWALHWLTKFLHTNLKLMCRWIYLRAKEMGYSYVQVCTAG